MFRPLNMANADNWKKISQKSKTNNFKKESVCITAKKVDFELKRTKITRITRSTKIDSRVSEKKTIEPKKKQTTRITRSTKIDPSVSEKKNIENPKKLSTKSNKVEDLGQQSTRITRSKVQKPKTIVQHVTPSVEPAIKSIVKRADFVKSQSIKRDDLVLAKQKYSCPWPARVLEVKKYKTLVFFFGDKRTGLVATSEIYDFVKSAAALKSLVCSKKTRGFLTGIREVEFLLGLNIA